MEGGEYKRGLWTKEEDKILTEYIRLHGQGKWNRIPKITGLKRCGKSCRLRWMNYLNPGVKRGNFSEEEDDLIIRLHKLLGNRWSLIAGRVPGRTDNQVKNHWNTNLSKKLGVKKVKCKAIRTRSKLAEELRENLNTNAPSSSNDGRTSSCNGEVVGNANVPDGGSPNSPGGFGWSPVLMTSDCHESSFWLSNDNASLYNTFGLVGIFDEPLDFLLQEL